MFLDLVSSKFHMTFSFAMAILDCLCFRKILFSTKWSVCKKLVTSVRVSAQTKCDNLEIKLVLQRRERPSKSIWSADPSRI